MKVHRYIAYTTMLAQYKAKEQEENKKCVKRSSSHKRKLKKEPAEPVISK